MSRKIRARFNNIDIIRICAIAENIPARSMNIHIIGILQRPAMFMRASINIHEAPRTQRESEPRAASPPIAESSRQASTPCTEEHEAPPVKSCLKSHIGLRPTSSLHCEPDTSSPPSRQHRPKSRGVDASRGGHTRLFFHKKAPGPPSTLPVSLRAHPGLRDSPPLAGIHLVDEQQT